MGLTNSSIERQNILNNKYALLTNVPLSATSSKTTQLGLFNFQSLLNLAILLAVIGNEPVF
jgi:hypothetical protein